MPFKLYFDDPVSPAPCMKVPQRTRLSSLIHTLGLTQPALDTHWCPERMCH